MIRLVRQPPNSNLCGQACVAMVAEVTLEEACAAFKATGGPVGLCRPHHVRAALAHFGYELGLPQPVPERAQHEPRMLKGLQIVRMRGDQRWGHLVVVHNGMLLDPGGAWPFTRMRLVTSYEVTG